MMRAAVPGLTVAPGASPAATVALTGSWTGVESLAWVISAERTAYPSMAELSCGGTSMLAIRSVASVRPIASSSGTSAGASCEKWPRMRARASSTLSISAS